MKRKRDRTSFSRSERCWIVESTSLDDTDRGSVNLWSKVDLAFGEGLKLGEAVERGEVTIRELDGSVNIGKAVKLRKEFEDLDVHIDVLPDSSPRGPERVARCRSLLGVAERLLPKAEREEALDEWIDEIETAAEEGLPVVRRTLSIVFRSLPSLALRSRIRARLRRGEGVQ